MQAVLLSDPDRKIRKAYASLRVFGGFRTAYLIDKAGVVRGAHEYVVVGIGRHVKKLLKGLEKLREEELGGDSLRRSSTNWCCGSRITVTLTLSQ